MLTVLVPTRGRPDNLAALWQVFTETCVGDTMLLACADEDDPQLPVYRKVYEAAERKRLDDEVEDVDLLTARPSRRFLKRGPRLGLVVGPRLRLGGTLNAVAPVFARQSEFLAFMGDDHRPRTYAWDAAYREALAALGTGLVYGNDLIQGANLPTQVAMTSDIVLATGHMVPPGAVHLFLDNAWLALGRALDAITYLPDVVVEHVHPIAGKAAWDAGYAECNTDALMDADRQVFERWQAETLPTWVRQIKEYRRG
ncbi:hypothetical protein OG900_33325 [Streptomyces sp. NBC_00433]